MCGDRLLTREFRRAVDIFWPLRIVRLIGRIPRAGKHIVRADVEQPASVFRRKFRDDLCSRRIDEAAEIRFVLRRVDRRVCRRVEDGVRLELLEDGAHRPLVREWEHVRGDTVDFVTTHLELCCAVASELSRCSGDEDFHSVPPFLSLL